MHRLAERRFIASVAVAASLAAVPAAAVAAASPGGDTLRSIAQQYYDELWRADPVAATEIGVHTYDAQLGSYGSPDFARDFARARAALSALQFIPNSGLSLDDYADKIILENAIKERLWRLQTKREWVTSPQMYTAIASNGVYGILKRAYAPLDRRLRYVIARERQIPRVLAQGEANIAPAKVAPVTARIALLDTNGAIDFFTNDVPQAFAAVRDTGLRSEFRASNADAVAALRSYQGYLQTAVIPRARGGYAIGAADYQYLEDLQNATHIPLGELERVGESALRRDKAAFIATARRIDPRRSAQAVYASISRDHPSGSQLLPTAQNELNDLVAFIKAKGIVDLPNAPIARVIATPKFQAQTSFASMDSPGPLETKATEAYYRVTLVDPAWTRKQAEEHLAFFNRYSLAVVSLHEAYPGHYTNYLFNKSAKLSLIRKLNWNVAFGEGWAHYDEQMMVDQGLGNGDPRMRMAQLALALQRECRYLVGIREHIEGMTVAQATAFFMNNAFMGQEPSHREALRGTQDPLYGYYTLGKLMLLKLRADDRAQLGGKFSLRVFHDRVLSHGDPPIFFLRKMILGAGDNGSLL